MCREPTCKGINMQGTNVPETNVIGTSVPRKKCARTNVLRHKHKKRRLRPEPEFLNF